MWLGFIQFSYSLCNKFTLLQLLISTTCIKFDHAQNTIVRYNLLLFRTKDVAEENVYDAVTIEDDTKIYDDIVAIKKKLDKVWHSNSMFFANIALCQHK